MKTPTAPNAEKTMTPDISGRCSCGRRLRLEDPGREGLPSFGEMLHVHRAIAGRRVEALDIALFVDACLQELEQLVRLRLAVHYPGHLADTDDLPGSGA